MRDELPARAISRSSIRGTRAPSDAREGPELTSVTCTVKSRYLGRSVRTTFTIFIPRIGVGEIAIFFASGPSQ
jgi:hypothetical protein